MAETKGTYRYHPCIILNKHNEKTKGPFLEVLVLTEFSKDSVKYTVRCYYNQTDKCKIIENNKCLYHRLNK